MSSTPVTIWQFLAHGRWHFHHIQEGHVPAGHRTITHQRFVARGARVWRFRRAYIDAEYHIIGAGLAHEPTGGLPRMAFVFCQS
jgi:hypothetical protein